MLAQRTDDSVMIDAVELEVKLPRKRRKISTSPRGQSGLCPYGGYSAVDHTADSTLRFIISNPPYYQQGVECATPQRERLAIPLRLITHRC